MYLVTWYCARFTIFVLQDIIIKQVLLCNPIYLYLWTNVFLNISDSWLGQAKPVHDKNHPKARPLWPLWQRESSRIRPLCATANDEYKQTSYSTSWVSNEVLLQNYDWITVFRFRKNKSSFCKCLCLCCSTWVPGLGLWLLNEGYDMLHQACHIKIKDYYRLFKV